MARYPFHFHMLYDGGKNSYIRQSAVHQSFFRGITVHATNNALVSQNVAYDITGSCYYIEDGVEERNRLEYNRVQPGCAHSLPGSDSGYFLWPGFDGCTTRLR